MQTISPITEQLIDLALTEDLCGGDFTTDAIFNDKNVSRGKLIAKSDLVLCGQHIFTYIIEKIESRAFGIFQPVTIAFAFEDGDRVKKGDVIAEFSGSTQILLKAERTALNFLQHMSGVATQTRALADLLPGIRVVNTRKAFPGLRELQHYAVNCGGGHSHRFNLGGGTMIKDNHIAAAGSIAKAIQKVRDYAPHTLRIEIEVETLDAVREALDAKADIIMLDNMTPDLMREACKIIGDKAIIEISGNVTVDKAAQIQGIPVYCASCGALTHSVTAADISMRLD
ncbi:MAG: carboxylating nicotinate-nucleotide diphosphorylase [Proteobacteria bacterium]|nr:carboxylating nicotinate-nucleotide diphosphorylase [Pseudomonadota bacterium]